jgi:hypothetical protein
LIGKFIGKFIGPAMMPEIGNPVKSAQFDGLSAG